MTMHQYFFRQPYLKETLIPTNMNSNNKGSSLYFAVAIMAIMLSIALGTSSILITQIRIIRSMGNSVVAIYAADAGIERILFEIRRKNINPEEIGIIEKWLSANTKYEIKSEDIRLAGENGCDALNFCIRAVGKYGINQRAIEVKF